MDQESDAFPATKEQSAFQFTLKDLEGSQVDLGKFKGAKAILAVNVACACGLTSSNYKQLVSIYDQYKAQGFQVWAFPCNQFGQQESGSENQIREFISGKFNVSFPVFSKIQVNGANTHPLYRFFRRSSSLFDKASGRTSFISWNFGKFLLNGDGHVVGYYDPQTQPNAILPDIKKLLLPGL